MSMLRTSFARSGVGEPFSKRNGHLVLILNSCQLLASARRYSTAQTQAKDSNLGFYLIGAGAAGLGAYAYFNSATPAVQAVKLKETSPLDPSKFIDLELKKVEHYNHNTAKRVLDFIPQPLLLTWSHDQVCLQVER